MILSGTCVAAPIPLSHAMAWVLPQALSGPCPLDRRGCGGHNKLALALFAHPAGVASDTNRKEQSPTIGREDEAGDATVREFLGISTSDLKRFRDNPRLYRLYSRALDKPVSRDGSGRVRAVGYLLNELGMSKSAVKKVILKSPFVLVRSSNATRVICDWMQERLGFDRKQVQKVLSVSPDMIGYKCPALETKLEWLQKSLGLEFDDALKVVCIYPAFFRQSTDTLEEKRVWLGERLGLDVEEIAKMFRTFPALFTYSIMDNLEPTLDWLEIELGDKTMAHRVISRNPRIFGCSLEDTLRPKIGWIQATLQMTREEALDVMVAYLPLLTCSVEKNLGPTIEFWMTETGGSLEKVRDVVMQCPTMLGSSLKKRLQPRVQAMKEVGVEPCFEEHWRPITALSKVKFEEWIESQALKRDPKKFAHFADKLCQNRGNGGGGLNG
ncbi:unnamed protein product, partial [Discosporangium mesarthrocarpum]